MMDVELKKLFQALEMKQFAPVYLVDGEEPYYIDRVTEYFERNILPEHERDFNLTVLYARDTNWKDVVNACRRFPMFAERQVVILKDAGQWKLSDLNELCGYVEHPTPTTLFLIEHRFKKADGRSALPKLVKKKGVCYTSEKLKDERAVIAWIQQYGQKTNINIPDAEAELLSTYLGNDLQKISNEIEKIRINVPEGSIMTRELIARYIGISREYSVFEFTDALIARDAPRIYQMLAYFGANPKSAPMPLLVGALYGQFNRLYTYHFLKDKAPKDIATGMGIAPFMVTRVAANASRWPLTNVEHGMLLLATYSARSVGIDTYTNEDAELMKEMIAQLL